MAWQHTQTSLILYWLKSSCSLIGAQKYRLSLNTVRSARTKMYRNLSPFTKTVKLICVHTKSEKRIEETGFPAHQISTQLNIWVQDFWGKKTTPQGFFYYSVVTQMSFSEFCWPKLQISFLTVWSRKTSKELTMISFVSGAWKPNYIFWKNVDPKPFDDTSSVIHLYFPSLWTESL